MNPIAYFQSDDLNDILEIEEKGCWEHTVCAQQLKVSEVICLGVNKPCRCNLQPSDIAGVIGVLTRQEKEIDQLSWSSDDHTNREYNTRYYLANIQYITKDQLEQIISGHIVPQMGLIYLDNRTDKPSRGEQYLKKYGKDKAAKHIFNLFGKDVLFELAVRGYNKEALKQDRCLPLNEFIVKYKLEIN